MRFRRSRQWVAGLAGATCLFVALPDASAKPYKGGELFSQQTYLYGRLTMRMRMANGNGILSTFFTYKDGSEADDTFWEEIDIEVFGKDNATSWQSNILTGLGTRTTSEEVHTQQTSLADDYHTYALVWTPEYVAWEFDGLEVRRTTTSQVQDLSNPESLRFNLWAANIVSWVGEFDDSVLPQYQFVNWISYSSYQNAEFVHEWTDEFDSFDQNRWGRADWTFDENLVDFDPSNVLVQDGTLVLALTHEGQTGFNGTVPEDLEGQVGSGGGPTEMGGSGGGPTEMGGSGGGPTEMGGSGGGPTEMGGSGGMDFDGTVGSSGGNSTGGQGIGSTGSGGQTSNPTSTGGSNTRVQSSGSGGASPGMSGGAPAQITPGDDTRGCSFSTSSKSHDQRGSFSYFLILALGAISRSRRWLKEN